MTVFVVDTNVGVVANGKSEQVDLACQEACITLLKKIVEQGILILDSEDRIFDEYKGRLSFAGQPGVGDFFFKWLFDNRYGSELIKIVDAPQTDGEFDHFPDDLHLSRFDEDDKKFVAAARAYGRRARIQIAADRGWWEHREALKANNVTVDFLCGTEQFTRTRRRTRA